MKNKANKMKLVHESDYRVMQRQGFWLPFLLLIGGIYLFIKFASYNYEYTQIQGELESYNGFYLDNPLTVSPKLHIFLNL